MSRNLSARLEALALALHEERLAATRGRDLPPEAKADTKAAREKHLRAIEKQRQKRAADRAARGAS